MARYELSVSPDYVPNWTEVEAVRELFQNALDSKGKMSWEYNKHSEILVIRSEEVGLTKDTLLFGTTTKADDAGTIGHFGEGYKLAFLTLARLGYKVEVCNYVHKELWEPKIINSKRYGSKLLVVDISKLSVLSKSGNSLTFRILNLKQETFDKITESNLHINLAEKAHETPYGRILRDENLRGKVFIKGLYVCARTDLNFGYDVKPEFLETNRDRNLVTDFNIGWVTSRMWSEVHNPMLVSQMVKDEIKDIRYINSFAKPFLSGTMKAEFLAMHGKYAVAVVDQKEYDHIRKTYKKLKPIFVKPLEKEVIYRGNSCSGSHNYGGATDTAAKREDQKYPEELMAEFFKKYKRDMRETARGKFEELVKLSKDWTFK